MKFINNLFKSDFTRNVVTLMTGTVVAQALPIAITPILTRIYSPEDFGVLALFISITAVLGAVANGKYELAVMLPKSNIEALNIVYLSILISSVFSVLLLVIVLLFNEEITELIGNIKIKNWLYFVPIAVFVIGLYNALMVYNNRIKKYKDISISSVSKSGTQSLSQIILGLLNLGTGGLIIGQVLSFFAGNLVLLKNLFKNDSFKNTRDKNIMKKMANKYLKFPKFSTPGIFINSVNLNSTTFLISSIFSVGTLGFYSLSQRMIGIPASVIGKSFSQIYYQKASEQFNKSESTEEVFLKTLKKLVLLGIPIFTTAYFIVEPLFAFTFGQEWLISGTYSKIVIPLAFARFLSSTLSITINIHNKQQYGLYINIVLLISTICVFYFGCSGDSSFENILNNLTTVLSLEYLLFLFIYWKISDNKL